MLKPLTILDPLKEVSAINEESTIDLPRNSALKAFDNAFTALHQVFKGYYEEFVKAAAVAAITKVSFMEDLRELAALGLIELDENEGTFTPIGDLLNRYV